MMFKLIVKPQAENDLLDAFSWYQDKRFGLGYDFMSQVDAGISFIHRNPEIHPEEYKGTRKHIVKRFPYKIIYAIENMNIIVLGVIHAKRSRASLNQIINRV